jgi:hypothetical protein
VSFANTCKPNTSVVLSLGNGVKPRHKLDSQEREFETLGLWPYRPRIKFKRDP